MARRDDAQLEDPVAAAALAAAGSTVASQAACTCDEFRRNRVCDHVLLAAAVRMVHRMIDIQKDEGQKPH